MRTQLMPGTGATTSAWIEHYPDGAHAPQKHPIESFPFTVGRIESVDFQIESARVSREHARFDKRGNEFWLQDLESTNGTFLNGEKVAEASLNDGDVVTIADVELTFFSGQLETTNRAVTQVMEGESSSTSTTGQTPPSQSSLLHSVRGAYETLAHRSLVVYFEPVYCLTNSETFGYHALSPTDAGEARPASWLAYTECRLADRLYDLHRMLAVEQALDLSYTHLFLSVRTSEAGSSNVIRSVARMGEVLEGRHQLVLELPHGAACDIPYFRTFREVLQELQVELCYSGFHGNRKQLLSYQEIPPSYVKLASSLARELSRTSGGQLRIQELVKAASDLGTQVIADGVQTQADVEILTQLGCHFAQGAPVGPPQTISQVSQNMVAAL